VGPPPDTFKAVHTQIAESVTQIACHTFQARSGTMESIRSGAQVIKPLSNR
jgi:hypothetical protein